MYCGQMRAGGMFCSNKTTEAGSWKFCFDENKIIPDRKTVIHNPENIPRKTLLYKENGPCISARPETTYS
jgi:hypothetical protein